MRIAIAYDCWFPASVGGGERQYRAFAEEFAARGHEVSYLTRRQWSGAAPAVKGVEVLAISGAVDLYDADGTRRPGPALRFGWDLFRHLLTHRGRYDAVVVAALPATNVLAARLALLASRVALAADWLEVWPARQWRTYNGRVAGTVAAILQSLAARSVGLSSCHSRVNERRLRAAGFRGQLLRSPGLVFPTDAPIVAHPAAAPPYVVYAGRHIADKRVESIPAAVALARGEIPGLRAVILGDGPTRPLVAAEVARLGLEDVVDLPGFLDEARMRDVVASAAALVNPSRREGYGLVVVEAAVHGTPTVLVDGESNAALELVVDGVNGAVATSTMPAELAAAIVRVVRAGEPLRASTASWRAEIGRTGSVGETARGVLAALETGRGR